VITSLRETGSEYQCRPNLPPRAGLNRLANRGSRQREYREVDAFRQFLRAFQDAPAVDQLVRPADEMDLTRKPVNFQALQDDLTGAAHSGR
jgi:hypothetical protein